MVFTKIDSAVVAKEFRDDVKNMVAELKELNIEPPLLVGFLANKDPAARKYAEWTGKACNADGLRYELRQLESPIDVEGALTEANDDPNVHGIIVYYPIFGQAESLSGASQDDYLRDTISYKCDVEGLCHTYRTNLYRNVRFLDYPFNNQKCVLPCTALSVVKILEHCNGCYDMSKAIGNRMNNHVVTVINRSEVVGRPLAAMLANDGADVYSVDIDSIFLFKDGKLHRCNEDETVESCVRKSSILITGVPQKAYRLPTEWVQPGTTVVNVASFKNIDVDELMKIPDITYVPSVGKVTVAMLERNLVRLFKNFHHPHRRIKALTEDEQLRSKKKLDEFNEITKSSEIEIKQWYASPLHLYTAAVVTILLAMQVAKR